MAESDPQITVIAADTHIRGEMTFDRTARVFGKFDGKVSAKGELQVAEGAACSAEVEAAKVTIDGAIEGDVTAQDRIQLNAKGRIKGDIKAAKLVVAEGASLFGHCAVGPNAASAAAEKPEIKTMPQQSKQPDTTRK